MVESGEATAAVILPEDTGDRIRSLASLNPDPPVIQIIVNGSDTVENQVTDDQIEAMLGEANLLLAKRLSEGAPGWVLRSFWPGDRGARPSEE